MNIGIEDYEQLISDGKRIQNTTREFQSEIDNIYSIIDDLKNSWTGESAKRYTDDIEGFKEDFLKLADLMLDHGTLIESVGKDYKRLEEEL